MEILIQMMMFLFYVFLLSRTRAPLDFSIVPENSKWNNFPTLNKFNITLLFFYILYYDQVALNGTFLCRNLNSAT